MEVDEIQRQVCKFQRVSSNGSTTTTDNSSNPQKIATSRGHLELQNHVDDGGGGGHGGGGSVGAIDVLGGGVARLCGWPSSRIVRVSRASGGKDRHSKVLTSKGLRDRRVRLSVGTAIQFYDLQDRLGYDQPSKAVEWLLKAAGSSIDELPSLDLPIASAAIGDQRYHHQVSNDKKKSTTPNNNNNNNNNNNVSQAVSLSKSPACSSTSETSKGSGLSLSRSENRVKARERARVMASKKDKEKEIDSSRVSASVMNPVNNNLPENSTFTDLLTGGINTATVRSPMEYYFNRPPQTPSQLFQLPAQFSFNQGDNNLNNPNNNHNNPNSLNNHHQQHQFSFIQDSYLQSGVGGEQRYNLNFSMTSPSSSSGGFTRGTLQSNLPSSFLPAHHNHQHHLQRFQSSSIDGSNLPFFIDHFPATNGYHLGYGPGGDGNKDKSKN